MSTVTKCPHCGLHHFTDGRHRCLNNEWRYPAAPPAGEARTPETEDATTIPGHWRSEAGYDKVYPTVARCFLGRAIDVIERLLVERDALQSRCRLQGEAILEIGGEFGCRPECDDPEKCLPECASVDLIAAIRAKRRDEKAELSDARQRLAALQAGNGETG